MIFYYNNKAVGQHLLTKTVWSIFDPPSGDMSDYHKVEKITNDHL